MRAQHEAQPAAAAIHHLKTAPARDLGILSPSECFEYIDPGIFPGEVQPFPPAAALSRLGGLDRLPCLLDPASRQEALRYLSGNFWHFPSFFFVLLDEAVDVAQCIRNIHKCQTDRADPRAFRHLICIDWPRGGPADLDAILFGRFL